MTVADFFGPGGLLERHIPGYEPRSGQAAMAEAVARALERKRPLLVEAPCGVGKTFAYLVPAVAHALEHDGRVAVCTANIALQEQIFQKDLPVLARLFPRRFTAALIKGLNNYLCLDRFEETRGLLPQVAFDGARFGQWRRIAAWREETSTGDVSDLDFEPDEEVWGRVQGVPELCNGPDCRFADECFALDARRRLRGAQVIVTNYHLFLAHLRLRRRGAGDALLPPLSAVLCDEAHELADIARDFFGRKLTPHSIRPLVQAARFLRLGADADRLRRASEAFFRRAREVEGRRLRRPGWIDASELEGAVAGFQDLLARARERAELDEERDKIDKFSAAAAAYRETLRHFLELDDPNAVYWIEKDDRSSRLQSRRVDVRGILEEELFRAYPATILCSATLTAGGDFGFIRRETGASDAEELSVPSPFDFGRQAILVVPRMRASPNDPEFASEMSGHINRILVYLGGRTMCLFTSYRNLEACARAAAATGVRILRQGDLPRSKLLAEFRKDEGTALFATSSFWQGVDVPGEALSCLVIDKIPFMSPADPLLEALEERDPQSFRNYSLPKAILDLRQGFGRLIRTRTDRGVVVIFDNRLFTKAYGTEVLSSLPACPLYRDLGALERFLPGRKGLSWPLPPVE
jgi:ATP-dependent DNA helicase DinG